MEVIYTNDLSSRAFEPVLNNIVHETDMEYLIAEEYFMKNKDGIISDVILYERERKTDKGTKGDI